MTISNQANFQTKFWVVFFDHILIVLFYFSASLWLLLFSVNWFPRREHCVCFFTLQQADVASLGPSQLRFFNLLELTSKCKCNAMVSFQTIASKHE